MHWLFSYTDSCTHILGIWLVVGFLGQFMFSMRFLVQWLTSEKKRKSVVPVSFWYFSIAGGLILFVYALERGDPVFILGQGTGIIIYIRNLFLVYKHKKVTAD